MAVRFSVVVPTRDRPASLTLCLRAIGRLDPPDGGFEVVVVNDGGVTPPRTAVDALRSNPHITRVEILTQPNAGPGAARNRGAAGASGEFLAFTDDDCTPDSRWLQAFDRALRQTPDALVGGRTVNALSDNVYSETSHLVVEFVASYFSGGARGRFFASNNFAVSRAAFLDAGGFDARFYRSAGEDREFSDRWSATARPSLVADDAVVRHAHHLHLSSFARQHFSYGRGARAFRNVRASRGAPVRVDLSFYTASLGYAYRHASGYRAPVVVLLTAGAHLAYVSGLLWASIRGGSPPTMAGLAS
jgi:glycosyltransferase involved in cell wall biosynthesis